MSPFTKTQKERLSNFASDLYNMQIWKTLGETGGNTKPDPCEFPDICEAYASGHILSVEAIYMAGQRILGELT